ncbi:tRNA threonylcarbamoyladenosine biosynthesis protein TsaE [Planctomycetales bacterium 10988]|nr:tRNA threonylcarbamoyladenosine biosynthesis protein TsaE [Planctomycetales bacterium 10988]
MEEVPPTWKTEIKSEAETEQLAASCAQVFPQPAVITLNGTLGAGKTRFVRALVEAIGGKAEWVSSPTYVLIQEYPTNPPVSHFDAYRIADEEEWWELGADEYFETGWTLIEWGERVAYGLPESFLEIRIDLNEEEIRTFAFHPHGEEYRSSVEQLEKIYSAK